MTAALRALLAALALATCLPARAVEAPALEVPDAALIEQRLTAAKADASLAEADRAAVVAQLQAAEQFRRQALGQQAEHAAVLRAVRAAPGRIAALRNEAAPAAVPPAAAADLATLGAALADAQAALDAALGEQDAADRRAQALSQAPLTLQPELAQARADLQALDTADRGPPPASGELAEAQALARTAQRAALRAGIALREERLRTVEIRRELAQAERDAAERRASAAQDRVDALSARLSAARQALARQELDDARALVERTADAHPLIRDTAARQADLTRELAGVLQADDLTGAAIDATQARQAEIETLLRTTQAQLELAELSGTLAQALHDRRLRLPRPDDYRREAVARNRDIGEARLRQLDLGERRRELVLPFQRASTLLEQAKAAPAEQGALRQQLGSLLRGEANLVGRLDDAYARRIALLSDLDRRQQQLLLAANSYAELLDRRLLWTPDVDPLGRGSLHTWRAGLRTLAQPARWAELPAALVTALATRPWAATVLLLPLALLGCRTRLLRGEQAHALRLADIYRDSAWLTARALVYSALRAAPWSLALYLLGRLLAAGAGEGSLAGASGAALSGIAAWVFMLAFLLDIARNGGVLDLHYQWRTQTRKLLRRQMLRLRLLAVPAGLLVLLGERLAQPALRATVGRLAFIVLSLALAAFLWRTVHPQRGAPAGYLAERPTSKAWRWRRIWHPVLVLIPLLPAALAAAGFYYAALQLQGRLVATAGWLLGVLLIGYLVLRALAVARRRLTLKQTLAPEAPDGPVPIEQLDVEAVDEQVRSLLGFGFSLAVLGVLLWVWADLLPALRSLDQVVLWRYRLGSDAEAATGAVTLLSLLLAGGVALLTVLGARNLPGALEIAVLQRLDMDAGARYAAITVTRYIIVTVGVLVTVNLLGLEWSKAQWLVAALGVGIGFGLQEIIANFISGLIILGERPFRVGDTVTVGGVSGKVARIRIRATAITDFDRKELIVPNKTFITEQFVNWTLSDQTLRLTIKVGVAYGSDTQRVCDILAACANADPRVVADPAPQILFMAFGESSLDFELRAYVHQPDDRLLAMHGLHMAIDLAFRQAGIEIPFPQRDLHLRSVDARAGQALGGSLPPAA